MYLYGCKKLFAITFVIAWCLLCATAMAGSLKDLEAGKEYGENMLRPAQIKACMLFDKRLDEQKSAIKALSHKLGKTEKNLHSLKTIVKRGLSSNSRREEVARYERKSKKFKELKVTYKEDSRRYDDLLQDYREDVDRYNSQCKNKERYEEDYKAVRKMMK